MSRPKKQTLGDQPEKKVTENFLLENPEDLPVHEEPKVVVAKHIPEYQEIVFVNQRDPGIMLEFHYKTKTHPMQQYKLLDGHQYKLPVEVIEHLESCAIPIYGKEQMCEDGIARRPIVGHKYMFACRNPKSYKKAA